MSSHEVNPVDTEELLPDECWSLLRTVLVGRLAIPGDGDIEVFPVNFLVADGSIVFRTASGTKLSRLLVAGRCTFEADDFDFYDGVAWSVVAKGPAMPIEQSSEIAATFDAQVSPWHSGTKPSIVELVPEQITGRRFVIDPQAGKTVRMT